MRERRSERHLMHLRMIYDDGEEYVAGFADTGSATGLMLEGPKPQPIGRELRLEPVEPLGDAWFELRARVTRCYEIDRDDSIARWGAQFYAIAVELIGVSAERELAIRKALLRTEQHALDLSERM